MGRDLRPRFDASPGHQVYFIYQYIITLLEVDSRLEEDPDRCANYRGFGYRARTQTVCATLLSPSPVAARLSNAASCTDLPPASMGHVSTLCLTSDLSPDCEVSLELEQSGVGS